jgi:SAM-dependent methyltransferase
LARRLGLRRPEIEPAPAPHHEAVDSWLETFHGDRLRLLDEACAESATAERYAMFRGLDEDLWSLLLTQQFDLYPNIKTLLPNVPAPELQATWNGRSGLSLASQSKAFYSKVRGSYARHGATSLSAALVLDFGCGWGRLTRYFARDVAAGCLFGCDPLEPILDVCRKDGVPATFARSDFTPDRLPFGEQFDLAFAFSVFTHLSEAAHERCLLALHGSLKPGGILVVTIRPPAFLDICDPLRSQLGASAPDQPSDPSGSSYLFAPHPATPFAPEFGGADAMSYGDTLITMTYIRERWARLFDLLEVNVLIEDPYQVMLTLSRV